jgi:hypothetical protein
MANPGTERSNLVKSGGIVVAWLAARSRLLLISVIAKNLYLFHDQVLAMDQLSGGFLSKVPLWAQTRRHSNIVGLVINRLEGTSHHRYSFRTRTSQLAWIDWGIDVLKEPEILRDHGSRRAWWLIIVVILSQGASAEPVGKIMLFSGEHKSMEWMLTDHEGASGTRGGKTCASCHIAGFRLPRERISVDVSIEPVADGVAMTLVWPGPETTTLGIMMDAGGARAFQRAGCWVGCHDDVRGMSADGDQAKYLGQTRARMTRTGGGSELKADADLASMRAESNLIEFLKVDLKAGAPAVLSRGAILDKEYLAVVEDAQVSAAREGDNWRVKLTLTPARSDTVVGFAVLQNAGGKDGPLHYMSLPGTLKSDKSGATLGF